MPEPDTETKLPAELDTIPPICDLMGLLGQPSCLIFPTYNLEINLPSCPQLITEIKELFLPASAAMKIQEIIILN